MRRRALLFALLALAACGTPIDGATVTRGDIAGDPYVAVTPDAPTGKPTVIYLHGATTTEEQALDADHYPGIARIVEQLAQAGFPVLAIRAGGDQWGNQTAVARIAAAVDGDVVLLGSSMGALNALAYASTHPVRCVVGLVPVPDPAVVLDARPDLADSINAAGPPVDLDVEGLRFAAWYGADDDIVPPSAVEDLVGRIGPTAAATRVPGDHNGALDHVPAGDVVDFISTC